MSIRSLLGSLVLFTSLAVPSHAEMVSGELVVLDGSADRFRLVGHDGTFRAPSGIPIAELDGKAVDVELSGGHVTQIVERPVAITPITSGHETVRGQMIVRDPVARSFGLAGDTRVYIAPASIDIAPFGGRWVEATLDSQGQVTDLRLVAEPPPPAPVSMPVAPVAPQPNVAASGAAATCMVGNATVASGSTICRGGVTNRCDNGTWVSLGTVCR